jgi:hypothetical protein
VLQRTLALSLIASALIGLTAASPTHEMSDCRALKDLIGGRSLEGSFGMLAEERLCADDTKCTDLFRTQSLCTYDGAPGNEIPWGVCTAMGFEAPCPSPGKSCTTTTWIKQCTTPHSTECTPEGGSTVNCGTVEEGRCTLVVVENPPGTYKCYEGACNDEPGGSALNCPSQKHCAQAQ